MERTLPNYITLTRFFLIFVIAIGLYLQTPLGYGVAFAVFAVSAATDWLDGYLARRLGQVSKWGIAMDPIGDKVQVVLTLLVLAYIGGLSTLGLVSAFFILFREIMVSGLREFYMKEGIATPVSELAKWKTATQLVSLTVLLAGLCFTAFPTLKTGGEVLLAVAALLTVMTGWQYYKGGMNAVHAKPKK